MRLLRGSLARSRLLLQLRAMSDDAYVDALNAALRSGYGTKTTPRRDCHCCRHRTLCSPPTHKYSPKQRAVLWRWCRCAIAAARRFSSSCMPCRCRRWNGHIPPLAVSLHGARATLPLRLHHANTYAVNRCAIIGYERTNETATACLSIPSGGGRTRWEGLEYT